MYKILFCCLLFFCQVVHAQYKLDKLVCSTCPPLDNPEQFAKALKHKARSLALESLGESFFYTIIDTGFRDARYYDNVFFEPTSSGGYYGVVFKIYYKDEYFQNIELKFSAKTMELLGPIKNYLPDCVRNPSECVFISKDSADAIGFIKLKKTFSYRGSSELCYRHFNKTFVWMYYICVLRSGVVFIDANDGKVLSKGRGPKIRYRMKGWHL